MLGRRLSHFGLFLLLSLPQALEATPEQPELTFEHLYRFGREAYTAGQWQDCVAFHRRALDDFEHYRDGVLHCRRRCGKVKERIGGGMDEWAFWAGHAQQALCLLKCRQERFTTARAPHLKDYAVYREDFVERRQPYHYLQFCYWKLGDLRSATQHAYTHLIANPKDEDTLTNLKFYLDKRERQLGELTFADGREDDEEDWLVDLLRPDFEASYIAGVRAYDAGDWQKCINRFERAQSEYFSSLEDCRFLCDDHFDAENFPFRSGLELSVLLTSLHQSVLRCRTECLTTLDRVNGRSMGISAGSLLARLFDYVHICYFRMNRGRDASQAVANGLLLRPGSIMMRRNRVLYSKLYSHDADGGESTGSNEDSLFEPSSEILAFHSSLRKDARLLSYVDEKFKYNVDGELPARDQGDSSLLSDEKGHPLPVPWADDFDYAQLEEAEGRLLSLGECHILYSTARFLSTYATPFYGFKYWRLLADGELSARIQHAYAADGRPSFVGLYCFVADLLEAERQHCGVEDGGLGGGPYLLGISDGDGDGGGGTSCSRTLSLEDAATRLSNGKNGASVALFCV